jgi:C-terminal processing protease CtpA/Prc
VDVIAGGPADEAGVKLGDMILAIDGKSAANLLLPELRATMRRWPIGRKVTLLLQSGGVKHTAIITLRDLV